MPNVWLSMPRFRLDLNDPKLRLVLDTLSSDPLSKLLIIWTAIIVLYFITRFIQPKLGSYAWIKQKKGKGIPRSDSGSTFQKLRSASSMEKILLNDAKNLQNESSHHPEASRCKPMVYGLRPQSKVTAGCMSESDDDESDLTRIELSKLQQTDAFEQWRIKNKMRTKDVQEEMEKVFVYKKLRKLHPESIWLLCSPDSLISADTVEPSKSVLFFEYLATRCIDIAVFVLIFKYILAFNGERHTPIQIAAGASVLYWFCARHWIRGRRPSSGALFSAYYESLDAEEVHAFKSGPAAVALANMMEDIFVIGTLGLGLVLSIHSRCFTTHAQSIAEKIFGIQIVIEKKRNLCD